MSAFFDEKFINNTLEGVVAQAFTDFFLAPAERLIILQQSHPKIYRAHPSDPPTYRGSLYYTSQIIKNEGFFALWKGNLTGTLKNAVHRLATSIFAKLYEPIFLKEDSEASTNFREFLLLTAVELSALLVQHPFKVIQIRMATDLPEHKPVEKPSGLKALVNCVKRIWEEEGLRGFYKGLSVALLQSFVRVMFLTIERNVISNYSGDIERRPKHKRRLVKELIYSGSPANLFLTYLKNSRTMKKAAKQTGKVTFSVLYKLGTALVLYPFNVVQTRMIAHEERVRLTRPSEVVVEMLEHEGFKGFYNGLLMTTIHTGGSFILLPVFRAFMKGFITRGQEKADEKKSLGEKGVKYLKKKKEKFKKFSRDAKDRVKEKVGESLKKHERNNLSGEDFSS